MTDLRPHRFPPLSQLASSSGTLSGGTTTEIVDGFQQGMEKGYEEGLRTGFHSGKEQGLKAGYDDGLREGRELGRREVLEKYLGIATPLEAAIDAVQRLQSEYQAALRKDVVDLVAKVARQVIRCELALQPLQILTMVGETLDSLPRADDHAVEVFLNPEEVQRIRELDPVRANRWKIIPDPRLEPGECHVKAGAHEADAGCRQRQAAVMEQVSAQLLEPAMESRE